MNSYGIVSIKYKQIIKYIGRNIIETKSKMPLTTSKFKSRIFG